MKHILKPIKPPFPAEIAEIFSRYPQGEDGNIIQLFRVFANSIRFLTSKGATNLLDKDSPLSVHERELVILRVTANCNCEYEWGVHVSVFAKSSGLTKEQVAATRRKGSGATCWSSEESLLIECIDQICQDSKIQDGTYSKFQEQWELDQQLEILSLCGNYHLISFVANTSRIPPEETGARFPS